jgi:uncharacterized LabA/DUF88 family protein
MTQNFNHRLANLLVFFFVGVAVACAFGQYLWVSILFLSAALLLKTTSQEATHQMASQWQAQGDRPIPEPQLTTVDPTPSINRGRVMIFVDTDNIHFSGRGEEHNTYVFYEEMVDYLFIGASIKVDARFYYNHNPKLENVVATMQAAGFTIVRPGNRSEDSLARPTDLDPEIIRDLDAYQDDYDTGVLVSGDQHFLDSIKKLISRGKRIEVVGFDSTTNRGLKRFCSQYIDIESLDGVCELRPIKKRDVEKPVLRESS